MNDYKLEMITETITNFDIFLISESKIDAIFPIMLFKINRCLDVIVTDLVGVNALTK